MQIGLGIDGVGHFGQSVCDRLALNKAHRNSRTIDVQIVVAGSCLACVGRGANSRGNDHIRLLCRAI